MMNGEKLLILLGLGSDGVFFRSFQRSMNYETNNNNLANITNWSDRAYTGHEQISELSGLVHMNARVYDNRIGRFLSADTIIQAPSDSQSFNRYAYVRNNPLMYTDPSGHSWLGDRWDDFTDSVSDLWDDFTDSVSDNADAIVGVMAVIAGGVLTATGNPYGPGMIASGAGLINGDYSLFNGNNGVNIHYNVTYTTNWGQSSGLTPHQESVISRNNELTRLQAQTSGTFNTVGDGKYANGGATSSYENMQAEVIVGEITIESEPETGSLVDALVADYGEFAYDAFTYTNVGAVYDTISQYYDGDISGIEAGVMLSASVLFGGSGSKVSKSLMRSKYIGMGSKLFGNSRVRTGVLNRPGSNIKVGWSQPQGGGGYEFRIGIGQNARNRNMANRHISIPGTFLPYSETDQIVESLRRFNRRYY